MSFDWFVLPFSIGTLLVFILVVFKWSFWIRQLPLRDRLLLNKGIFSFKVFKVIKEVILESLFHRRIFKINPVLGYMHMSFAFGWFMLIVIGNLETRIYSGAELNLPYYSIFFKFFLHKPLQIPLHGLFTFIMDFFLLMVLSGVFIALFKRIRSKVVGMKKTTKLKPFDILAMLSLWLIFPSRLIAESMAAGMYQTGGFMTQPLGDFFASLMPLENISYFFWWLYSFALGAFFVCLPYSRYMHIPTEILLIAFRHFGIRRKKTYDIFKDVEVFSCSRCGICIDKCQINSMANIQTIQPAYFLKSIRKKNQTDEVAQQCLMCGRCQQYCPVGIHTDDIRISQRLHFQDKEFADYSYCKTESSSRTDVLYFAGCMTHLTPSIKNAMLSILNKAGVRYQFFDESGSVCCGRPMLLSGNLKDAQKLKEENIRQMSDTGAKILVTSCPICLRMFREEYNLPMKVMHHSQYLRDLVSEGKIILKKDMQHITYHDPCEMGRALHIYEEPRELLQQLGDITNISYQKENSLCCGGSLGNNQDYHKIKDAVSKETVAILQKDNPDVIATACPLCKKTFVKYADCRVADLAELVNESMNTESMSAEKKMKQLEELV